jgi:hypothetical protein
MLAAEINIFAAVSQELNIFVAFQQEQISLPWKPTSKRRLLLL